MFGLLIASPALIGSGTAKAPPEPVCGVCTGALDEAARERGVTVERGQSTMTIRVSETGRAEFVAGVELLKGAEQLNNDSLRHAIVKEVSYTVVDDRRNLRTSVVGDTLRVRYSSDEVAHKTLGIVQFDAFHTRGAPPFASGGEGTPYPGADRLLLYGPPGYHVHGSPGDVTNETAVRWRSDSHEQYSGLIEEDVTISFVPERARLPHLRVALANFVDRVDSFSA
ncbi:hypothetical protein [Halobellus ruber]|uniref:Uncharacterized protein n=1 Tax=Halobellus ruber TaxID=2761102 RepID=A0A7J9SLI3_9EURY|nr:hypothetical protein [Halobellus ruber]MBB6647233.1 hypothetical protein [Halobellus ruber]